MAYTHSASSGANTVSVSFTGVSFETISVARFTGLSGTLDGTLQTATYTGNVTGGPGSFNTSITTTNNGSLIISCAGNTGFGSSWLTPSSNTEYVSFNAEQAGSRDLLTETHTNALGAYTPTFNTYNDFGFGSHATFAAQTLAFKPNAIGCGHGSPRCGGRRSILSAASWHRRHRRLDLCLHWTARQWLIS